MKTHRSLCFTIRRFSPHGGLEKAAARIADGFARRGVQVTILTSEYDGNAKLHPLIDVVTLPLRGLLPHIRYEAFDTLCDKYLERHPHEGVFAMDRTRSQEFIRAGNGVHAAYLAQRLNQENFFKRVQTRLNPLHRTILNIEKEAFESEKLKILFTNSYMVRKDILKHYSTDPSKIHVIHNGVEWRELESDFQSWLENKPKVALSHRLDPSQYHFLFIGNGYARKGLIPLLNAMSLLKSREIHLSVVGNEKRIPDFISHAKKLGLEQQVTFYGPMKNVRPLYQLADSLVIPSFYDPFANVTVEGLAMGLYIVSSKTNGGYEVLKEENGTVIPDIYDAEGFARSLTKAIAHPKTWIRSQAIRGSIQHLDFNNQLTTLIGDTLATLEP